MNLSKPHLFILAGGYGTRLRSKVSEVPKPLAPVGKFPFLFYVIDAWYRSGVRRITLLLHYLPEPIIAYIKSAEFKSKFSDVKIDYIIEPQKLGTGGAILNAIDLLCVNEPFLVSNADTWFSFDLDEIVVSEAPCMLSVFVAKNERYGEIESDGGTVISFQQALARPEGAEVNTGCYLLSEENFSAFEVGSAFSLENDILPLLSKSRRLKAICEKGAMVDIGVPEDYEFFTSHMHHGVNYE